jgi:hypothetical protein
VSGAVGDLMASVNGFWESSFVFATLSGGEKWARRSGRRCFGCDEVVQPAAADVGVSQAAVQQQT